MIRVDGIDFSYGDKKVLSDVSLHAKEGELHFLIGRNGSGKTTLLKETVRLNSEDVFFLPSQTYADPDITGYDLIDILEIRKVTCVEERLAGLGLERDILYKQLWTNSQGERQMVWFVLALAFESPNLIMDEPSSNVDLGHLHKFRQYIEEECGSGKTLVITSHDFNWMLSFPSPICHLLNKGQILCHGSVIDVVTNKDFDKTFGIKSTLVQSDGRRHLLY